MISLKKALCSSVFRKLLTAVTGLALVGFVVTHLLGNLTLYANNPTLFNAYAFKLESFGVLLEVAEIGLVALFVLHVVNSIALKKNHLDARPQRYRTWKSKQSCANAVVPSNRSARIMAVSGTLLLLFVVFHVWHFKYGPGLNEGYTFDLDGIMVRDLHRLVVESFTQPLYVIGYVVMMVFLGLHLRHGIWSALHSLGLTSNRTRPALQCGLGALGVLLAVGFLLIPVFIFFSQRGGM